jgi:hypothetical protein
MNIIELILDETEELMGIQAISIVESPAIEENFIAMKSQEVQFAKQDEDKRILMGAALVPNKPIYRKNGEDEFYVYFTKDTIRRASEMFLQKGNQNESTLEHNVKLNGLSVVESWIIEDEQHDKTRAYGLNLPVGTWMVSMKVNNEDVWKNYVKTGKVKGFSIEGYFVDKVNFKSQLSIIEEAEAMSMLSTIRGIVNADGSIELESYSDYPDAVKNNAKRGIKLNAKINNRCATSVGKVRAQQLAQGKPLSVETIKRMYSYLSRAEEYYDEGDSTACGTISYLLWGGLAAKRWSASKLKELGLWEE